MYNYLTKNNLALYNSMVKGHSYYIIQCIIINTN